jgi:hypothetical protein
MTERHTAANQRLKLIGAAILIFRASTFLQAPRQLSLGVPEACVGRGDRSIGRSPCARRCRRTDAR